MNRWVWSGNLRVALCAMVVAVGPAAPVAFMASEPPEQEGRAATAAVLYSGPLFSVHEHFGAGRITTEQVAQFFASVMDKEGVNRVVAFVPASFSGRPGQGEEQIRSAVAAHPHRFVPFWRVTTSTDFLAAPQGLRQVFSEGPFWVGSGEWPLYGRFEYRPGQRILPADDPVLLQVYDVVADLDRTVMVHPDYGREALERALRHNRQAPFLIHGAQASTRQPPCRTTVEPLKCMDVTVLTELMRSHSNFFFDVSATANPHLRDETVGGVDVKTHFRVDMDSHVDEAFRFYGAAFEDFPDRFLLGWDYPQILSNLDPEFFALGVEFYRKLLGKVTATTAELIAYRNAERLLFRIPTLLGPPPGVGLTDLGLVLSWINPPNTIQYQFQLLPARNDGPAINVIRDAEDRFTVAPPVPGQGPFILLPDMTYSWRVRTTASTKPIDENSPLWRPWSEVRMFRTPRRDSSRIAPAAPLSGAAVDGGSQVLEWGNGDRDVFYYEIQVSPDPKFGAEGPVAPVWHNLVHGGVSSPPNSWRTPELQPNSVYYWRVRPRVQGDGVPVDWSPTWTFRTP